VVVPRLTAHSKSNLKYIVDSCAPSQTDEAKLKAATVIGLLSKSPNNWGPLVKGGLLKHLVAYSASGKVDSPHEWSLQRAALMTLFDLSYCTAAVKQELVELGCLKSLIQLLDGSGSKDVQYWALVLLHSLVSEQSLQPQVLELVVIPVLVRVAIATQGTFATQKLAMHALILLATSEATPDHTALLSEMVQHGIIPVAVVALKAEDEELVYYALGVLHEIAVRHVASEAIKAMPRLIATLQNVLTASDASTQKIVLRTIGFLAIKDVEFKVELLAKGMISRLVVCLGSGEEDVSHWAVVLLHDIAMLGVEACHTLLRTPSLIRALAALRRCKDPQLPRLAAETYGFLCTHQELYQKIVELGIIEGIITLAQYRDAELHFWAAALLLNLVGVSDVSKRQMVQYGAIDLLSDLVCAPRREVGEMAAKALIVLAMWKAETAATVLETGVAPLLHRVLSVDTKTTCHNPLLTRLALFTR